MKKTLVIFIFLIGIISTNYAQEKNRLNSIKNKIELLKIDNQGLDEALNINITQTTLSNFLLAISKVHGLNINVSPELNNISIVNNFSNVTVEDILLFLVKEYNLDIDFTGNILSIKNYIEPEKESKEKEINAIYNPLSQSLSLDLKNDKLDKVFRKIMDQSGKNLLFSPEIESKLLSIYINDIPFDVALEKLADSNNLELSKSNDGFYVFDTAFDNTLGTTNGNNTTSRPIRKKRASFYYKVKDTVNRIVEVDFKNTPVSDIIYTLGEDLKLDIFTASPIDDAGISTVKAKNISFDLLLDKIFESAENNLEDSKNNSSKSGAKFTYKKSGSIYYFGTEDQLSLKQLEVVSMMHRSIQLLKDPSGNGQRRAGRSTTNFGLNNLNTGNNSNFNNRNTNNQNQNNRDNNNTSNRTSIEDIIPDDILEGLDIKIDVELNSFVVSGPGVNVERFKDFIKFIDKPVPVILIEVMIMEVNRSAITETGISFGVGDKPVTTQGEFFPSGNVSIGASDVNKIIGNFNGFGALNIGKVVPNFYLDIKAMEAAGTIKVKSTPKMTTINGHKAYLSSGETTYYAVTSQSFYGSQIPQTSEIKNYVPIDAELSLEILPFVSGDGQITLDIQVLQSAFNGERIAEDAPPGMTSREFSSIVRMQDQDVVVLGGIESIKKDNSGSGVPFLARIPIIRWFFSKRRREATKHTLNIMIKPTIID